MQKKPFHESVVMWIRNISAYDNEAHVTFFTLLHLIGSTKVPKNHDEIIDAIVTKSDELGVSDESDVKSVIEDLYKEKELVKDKPKKKLVVSGTI
jgi:hypothetical protein